MLIIADAGATKCAWKFVDDRGQVVTDLAVAGINFAHQAGRLREALDPAAYQALEAAFRDHPGVRSIFFYGAGVIVGPDGSLPDSLQGLAAFFRTWCPGAEVEYASDLLGAARAVCQRGRGIAAILGTGSNSCFYDGRSIAANVRAGVFILGDEASGAWFGKQLLSDFVKGLLPQNLTSELVRRYGLDYPTIVQKVYRDPLPSRYLASFLPFIGEYANHPYCRNLLRRGFEAFLTRNVAQYDYRRYPVNFTGSVAWVFRDHLESCLKALGMRPGTIVKKPADLLAKYHKG